MGALLLALVTLLTSPALAHFPGALIPWPTHGLALALVLAAPQPLRTKAALLVAAAIFLATVGNALLHEGRLPNAIPATALLMGQTLGVVALYDWLGGEPPLARTGAYALLLLTIIVGPIPFAIIAHLLLKLFGSGTAPGYTPIAFWVAASSSGAALVGGILSLFPDPARAPDPRSVRSPEFVGLLVAFGAALLTAFGEIGPLAGHLPHSVATLPFLAWAGIRFGLRGFGVVSGLLIATVLTATWLDIGVFGSPLAGDQVERFRQSWIYLGALVGPALLFPVAIAERSAAERRARAAFAQLNAIVEGSGDLIAAVDRDLTFLSTNAAWREEFVRLSGITVRAGMSLRDAMSSLPNEVATSVGLWTRAIRGERFTNTREVGDASRYRAEYEVSYGPIRDENGDIVGASQVVRPVTERRRRDAEEAQARRLESIGRLAGGVAHDFNNLMTSVMGYTALVGATLGAGDPRLSDLAEVERAAAKAGELTQQLLAFARQRVVAPRVVDPGDLVRGFTTLLAPLLGPRITLRLSAAPTVRTVHLDPRQFEQVVMNLAINARDAMPGGGELRIEVANDERAGVHGVRLSVRDSGIGMSEAVQARIFEPFFTTKAVGEGTGLGLATVHGIVHQAGGAIDVESVLGEGTIFHIFFPAADAAGDGTTPTPA